MNVSDERSRSLWLDDAPEISAPAYAEDGANSDVAIIGSGISGLSVAYALAQRGRRVIVLDRGPIGRGMTARTTAHLASELDDFYSELIKRRSADEARLFAESQIAAIDSVEAIVRDNTIDCDFARVDGYLFGHTRDAAQDLEEEYDGARAAGLPVEWADRAPMLGVDTGPALRFPDQARIHPLKYLAGLARAIEKRGGRLYADSAVVDVDEDDGTVELTLENGAKVQAQHVVVAANTPFNDRVAIHTKQAPYRTYAMAFEVPSGAVHDALMWDTLDPYHYVRIQPGRRGHSVIVGGEDHRTGLANDAQVRFANLDAWARARFPGLGAVSHSWSGQVYEPVDYLPYIGRNPGNERVFIVTGDSGQGMTMGATAGLIIPDLIEGRENRWAEIFRPSRKSLSSALTYLDENKDVAANFAEYVAADTKASADEINPGEGGLLRDGVKIIAAYRDPRGELHMQSAACTHIGCIVHWNSFEQCWDCPCHGSQFSPEGDVMQGPAFRPLGEMTSGDRDAEHDRERSARDAP
jgi:glycine/D-amino acid oxidase-like deaminating enzyme/nitrite reductase/ring-hydroxylating ferredoxin subunit